jgi:hypothetical protein
LISTLQPAYVPTKATISCVARIQRKKNSTCREPLGILVREQLLPQVEKGP